jgi:hypothetical protein
MSSGFGHREFAINLVSATVYDLNSFSNTTTKLFPTSLFRHRTRCLNLEIVIISLYHYYYYWTLPMPKVILLESFLKKSCEKG